MTKEIKDGYIIDFISGQEVKSTQKKIQAVQVFAKQLVEDYGFKSHIKANVDHLLIRSYCVTTAFMHYKKSNITFLSRRFFRLAMLLIVILSCSFIASSVQAAEYLRSPFTLSGSITVPGSDNSAQGFNWRQSAFENTWYQLQIRVYKDTFVGYSRYVDPKNSGHVSLLSVSGNYERGYLVGTWEYQEVIRIVDRGDKVDFGPYPKTWEASGRIVSSAIQYEQPVKANVIGTVDFYYSGFGEGNTPEKPVWEKKEFTKEIAYQWNGKTEGITCGGFGTDDYVGKKAQVGIIYKDWSYRAKILHCGLSDGNKPVEWQLVKDNEPIYASDQLLLDKAQAGYGVVMRLGPENNYHNDLVVGGLNWQRGGGGLHIVFHPNEGGSPRSSISLIAGVLWQNTKDILTKGSFEIQGSQAAMGIKGTNYIITESGTGNTTLMVLEGTVEMTSKADGTTKMINEGQMITASDSGFSKLESLDPKPLLSEFYSALNNNPATPPIIQEDDYTIGPLPEGAPSDTIKANIAKKGGMGIFVISVVILLFIVGAGLFFMKNKKIK